MVGSNYLLNDCYPERDPGSIQCHPYKRAVPASGQAAYKKWIRYYLDFCSKYPVPDSKSERVRLFIEKLREKKRTLEQQKQAAHAVSLL
jgi:Phage integrase, N-terminal SAM-like domain